MDYTPGDVFAVPVQEGLFGFGQIIAYRQPVYLMIGFNCFMSEPRSSIVKVVASPILLAGNFFDVLLRNNTWVLIGNTAPNVEVVPFQFSKVMMNGKYHIQDWNGSVCREATDADVALYDFSTNRAPMMFQNALREHSLTRSLPPKYQKLDYQYCMQRSQSPSSV